MTTVKFSVFFYLNDHIRTVEHTTLAGKQGRIRYAFISRTPFCDLVICLQETFLRESKNITFKGFSSYQKPAQEVNGVLHGGATILVNSSIPHRQLDLQTSLQAVANRISYQTRPASADRTARRQFQAGLRGNVGL